MLGALLTAIVTPFKGDGTVDVESFRALCRYLVDNGSDGIVVTGTTGEAPTLTDDERFTLYAAAVDEVGGDCSVIAGTGTYATAHSVHLTDRAHQIGVDGFLVVTPYYNKPPQRGIVAHVEAIAAATDRPIIFYDIPSRVVVDATSADDLGARGDPERPGRQAVETLARGGATRGRRRARALRRRRRRDPPLPRGRGRGWDQRRRTRRRPPLERDDLPLPRGDLAGARAINDELAPAIDLLRVQTNPIAIKTALNLLGHRVGGFRLPLVEATDDEAAAVRTCLERLGLLQPIAA